MRRGWIGQHVQDDRLVAGQRALQGRADVGGTLDTDACAAELLSDLREIVLAELPAEVRFARRISAVRIRLGAPVGPVRAVVVDHYDHRYPVARSRLQFRQVVVEAAVASEADHRSIAQRALRADRSREAPAQ